MALPEWRRRQLGKEAFDREQDAVARMGAVMGLDDESAEPHVHEFPGPHPHRCQTCQAPWIHQERRCATPTLFTPTCPNCQMKGSSQ